MLWLCCLELGGFLKIGNWIAGETALWPEWRELIIRVRAKIQAQDSSKSLQSYFQAAVFTAYMRMVITFSGFGFSLLYVAAP
ncbi:MAG: hypothetical protein ED554_02780 [Synechococcus sp. YX04-3]|nr:MAG: hypothetical protein ED554_02780 [Synechococcus sp. YX04-3]